MSTNNGALSWNSEIASDDKHSVLPSGEYWFVVDRWERAVSREKGCDMAVLHMRLYDDETGRTGTCRDYLVLHKDAEWKLAAFFRAIGEKRHGQSYRMNWDVVTGAWGRAQIHVDTYSRDGVQYQNNKVTRYLDCVAGWRLPEALSKISDDVPF